MNDGQNKKKNFKKLLVFSFICPQDFFLMQVKPLHIDSVSNIFIRPIDSNDSFFLYMIMKIM